MSGVLFHSSTSNRFSSTSSGAMMNSCEYHRPARPRRRNGGSSASDRCLNWREPASRYAHGGYGGYGYVSVKNKAKIPPVCLNTIFCFSKLPRA